MSASVTSRSSITKPPETSRLWTPNWRITSASAGPGPGDPAVGLEEAALALARQQRLAVVELADEVEPLAQRLGRVHQPEAGAAQPTPGTPRRGEDVLGEEGRGRAIAASSGRPKGSVPRVSTGLPKTMISRSPRSGGRRRPGS